MRRSTLWQRVRRIWIATGLTATVLFAGWSLLAYRASAAAKGALRSGDLVIVAHEAGVWSWTPAGAGPHPPVGLLFFPGALVDPVAYAPLLRAAAEAGFVARMVEVPRRGAFGGAESAELHRRTHAAMGEAGGPTRWVLAGHSRGAVIASELASRADPAIAGVVLIGSSHPRDVSLASLSIPVTKIVGTRDGLASPGEVRANEHLLPDSTRWVWVDGGNHSQFGWYGFQPGDRRATISAADQRASMIQAVIATLRLAAERVLA